MVEYIKKSEGIKISPKELHVTSDNLGFIICWSLFPKKGDQHIEFLSRVQIVQDSLDMPSDMRWKAVQKDGTHKECNNFKEAVLFIDD
jgi:hypothetical protein